MINKSLILLAFCFIYSNSSLGKDIKNKIPNTKEKIELSLNESKRIRNNIQIKFVKTDFESTQPSLKGSEISTPANASTSFVLS